MKGLAAAAPTTGRTAQVVAAPTPKSNIPTAAILLGAGALVVTILAVKKLSNTKK